MVAVAVGIAAELAVFLPPLPTDPQAVRAIYGFYVAALAFVTVVSAFLSMGVVREVRIGKGLNLDEIGRALRLSVAAAIVWPALGFAFYNLILHV